MKNRTLANNTISLYIVTFLKLAAPLVTLPYLTRVLSVHMYGDVAFMKAYCTYVQLFLDFGFLLSATKNIVKARNDTKITERIIGDTIVEKSFIAVGTLVITFIAIKIVPAFHGRYLFAFLYVSSCIATILIIDFLYRGIERMSFVAIPFSISKLLVIILTFLVIKSDADYLFIPTIELVGNLIAGLISIALLKKVNLKIRVSSSSKWLADLKESFIYFISNFATTFFGALTTLIIGIFMNSEDVAYWSLCMMVISAIKALYSPISNSLYPHMVANIDLSLIHRICALFSIPVFLGCFLILAFGEQIMGFFAGDPYQYSGQLLKYMIPVIVFSFYSMMYGWPVLGPLGKEKETTVSTIISAGIQLIGLLMLIATDSLDLFYVAICCCVSEASLLIIRLLILKRSLSE